MFKKIDIGGRDIKDFVGKADLKKNTARRKRSETYVAVYFSQEEKEKLLELAGRKGLSASSFIRSVLKEHSLI